MLPSAAPPPPTYLLYDWDNTLVDGWAGVAAALNAVFTAFGHAALDRSRTPAPASASPCATAFPLMFGDRWARARDMFYATLSEPATCTTSARCRAPSRR